MPQNVVTKNRCIYFKLFFEYWYISTMTTELYWRPGWCPMPCLTLKLALLHVFNLWMFFISLFLEKISKPQGCVQWEYRCLSLGDLLYRRNSCNSAMLVKLCPHGYSSLHQYILYNCRLELTKLPRKAWLSPLMCVVWPEVAQTPERGLLFKSLDDALSHRI